MKKANHQAQHEIGRAGARSGRKLLNLFAWVVIVLFIVATVFFVGWASRQPRTHSIWGSDEAESQ